MEIIKRRWIQMPRTRRLVNGGEKTAYHVMSRTALDGFPFGDVEKDELVKIILIISDFGEGYDTLPKKPK
jgi:hypothetical protein